MILGILSDTHDHPDAMAAAMKLLRDAGAEFFIHCGDVGGERILDLLAGVPALFVWGNTDYDRADLARYAADLGIDCRGTFADLELAGKKIAVTHGDDTRLMQRLVAAAQYDYLFHGHTHVLSDRRVGPMRIINPGALHRAPRKTVARVDLTRDTVQHLTVNV
jgi:hypothetical protein